MLRGELSTPQSQLRHNLGWWGQIQGGMAWTRPQRLDQSQGGKRKGCVARVTESEAGRNLA